MREVLAFFLHFENQVYTLSFFGYNIRKGQSRISESRMPCMHEQARFQIFDERSELVNPKDLRVSALCSTG